MLTQEEYDTLPASAKKLYVKDGDGYKPKAEAGDDAIRRALDHEKAERKRIKDELDELKAEKDKADLERSKKDNDVDAVTKSWEKKYTKLEADKNAVIGAREGSLRKLLVQNKAQELAGRLATDPELLLPFIERRLDANFGDNGEPSTLVLDTDGKPSALSLVELEKEVLADKRFSRILKGSSASGGGASGGGSGGGASDLKVYKNADGTTNWSKVHQDMAKDPELLSKVKAYNSDPSSTAAQES